MAHRYPTPPRIILETAATYRNPTAKTIDNARSYFDHEQRVANTRILREHLPDLGGAKNIRILCLGAGLAGWLVRCLELLNADPDTVNITLVDILPITEPLQFAKRSACEKHLALEKSITHWEGNINHYCNHVAKSSSIDLVILPHPETGTNALLAAASVSQSRSNLSTEYRQALTTLSRCLKPNGQCLLMTHYDLELITTAPLLTGLCATDPALANPSIYRQLTAFPRYLGRTFSGVETSYSYISLFRKAKTTRQPQHTLGASELAISDEKFQLNPLLAIIASLVSDAFASRMTNDACGQLIGGIGSTLLATAVLGSLLSAMISTHRGTHASSQLQIYLLLAVPLLHVTINVIASMLQEDTPRNAMSP